LAHRFLYSVYALLRAPPSVEIETPTLWLNVSLFVVEMPDTSSSEFSWTSDVLLMVWKRTLPANSG